MSASGLPTPKRIVVNGESLFVSMFSTDILLNVGTRTIKSRQVSLPVSFQANCRKLIQTKIGDIAKWFNPVPTREKLERVITTLPVIECSADNLKEIQSRNIGNIVIRMDGIIVEDNRILPYLTISIPKISQHVVTENKTIPKSQDSLVEVVDLELELESPMEIHKDENKVIHRHFDMEGGPDDDEDDDEDDEDDEDDGEDEDEDDEDDDEDDEDDDGEDTDDDFDRNFERVQRTLDSAREELEALRRRHLAKKSDNRS